MSCWNKTKVGSGTPNKAFVDKNGKLYVGDAALGYFTNASGPWVSKSLNSDRWAIDENGNPHTVRKVGAGSPLATSGLVYSKLVGGTWASEDIPEVDGCECPVTPPCAFIVGPTAWDIVVAPGGAPHVVWNDVRSFGCGGSPIAPFPMHSYKNGVQWVTDLTAIWLENNGAEAQHVAGIMDGTHFAQAFMTNGLRAPRLLTTNPSGIAGVLYTEGEASGQIVLAKPNGLPVHALFSGWWYDELGPEPTLESVILTEDVAEPKQTNAKTTLLSCPGEQAKHHALAVSSAGVVWAAWLSTSDQIRFATNESGVWVHADLGTGTGVEVVVTGSGQVNVFIGQSGDIYWMTPCS